MISFFLAAAAEVAATPDKVEEFRAVPVPSLAGPAPNPIPQTAAAAAREDTLTTESVSWPTEMPRA
jgi:hypothetical protein